MQARTKVQKRSIYTRHKNWQTSARHITDKLFYTIVEVLKQNAYDRDAIKRALKSQ